MKKPQKKGWGNGAKKGHGEKGPPKNLTWGLEDLIRPWIKQLYRNFR